MKAKLLIQPAPTQNEPTRHKLYLQIGVQRFDINADMENREHALWTAQRLHEALVNASTDVEPGASFIKRGPDK